MKLSVVIPNRNDTVMLAITLRSILEELKSLDGEGEVVIVDNSDDDIFRIINKVNVSPLPLWYKINGNVKLIRQDFPSLYSARQTAIEAAEGEYVYNLDSHMLVGNGHFRNMVSFMDNRPEKLGLGFMPIGWVGAPEFLARHDIRTDETGVFGSWGRRYYQPTKICWNFGACVFDKDWYMQEHGGLDFFSDQRISWGGGEFYAAMKTWLLGYENWAIPNSPQYHIGPFSKQVQRITQPYRTYGNSGKEKVGMGILAAFYALGGDAAFKEAEKASGGLKKQYGIDPVSHWNDARRIAGSCWEKNKRRFVTSFNDILEERPWSHGWDSWDAEGEYLDSLNG